VGPQRSRTVAVLVNPASGRGRGLRTGRDVARQLVDAGDAVSVLIGDTAEHSARLVQDAVAGGVDVVVAVGGDGMVHLAVQALAGSATALGIVPSGTGNDYARALGIPRRDPTAATELIATTEPVPTDLARLDGPDGAPPRWFAAVLSAGFDSRANALANRLRFPRGGSRYTVAVLAGLRDTGGMDLTLTVDGVGNRHRAELVTIGNTAYYGGGLAMLAGADPTDGLLDVVVVDEVGPLRLLALFPRVFSGGHLRLGIVHRYRGVRVQVASADRAVVSFADGEQFAPLPLDLTCVPGAARVFRGAPPTGPGQPGPATSVRA